MKMLGWLISMPLGVGTAYTLHPFLKKLARLVSWLLCIFIMIRWNFVTFHGPLPRGRGEGGRGDWFYFEFIKGIWKPGSFLSFTVKTVDACPSNFETLCWSLEDWIWVFPKSWEREFETWNGNSEVSRQDWFQLSLEKFKPSNWNFRLRTRFFVFVSE